MTSKLRADFISLFAAIFASAALAQAPTAKPAPAAPAARASQSALATVPPAPALRAAKPAPEPAVQTQDRHNHHRAIWITSAIVGAGVATILLVHHYHKAPCYNPVVNPVTGAGC